DRSQRLHPVEAICVFGPPVPKADAGVDEPAYHDRVVSQVQELGLLPEGSRPPGTGSGPSGSAPDPVLLGSARIPDLTPSGHSQLILQLFGNYCYRSEERRVGK